MYVMLRELTSVLKGDELEEDGKRFTLDAAPEVSLDPALSVNAGQRFWPRLTDP